MISLGQELGHAARALSRNPLFTTVAVLILGLGIGANAAVFSFVNAVSSGALPFPEPHRLVNLYGTVEREETELRNVSYPELVDWMARTRSFAGMAGAEIAAVNLAGRGESERVDLGLVTPGYFKILGVSPLLGRVFRAEEDRPPSGAAVAVLGHAVWQRHFGADAGVLGRKVVLGGVPFEVIGVMPEGFGGERGSLDLWVPVRQAGSILPNRSAKVFEDRNARWIDVVARLAPGVTVEQAQAEMNAVADRMRREYPSSNADRGARVILMEEDLLGDVQGLFRLLFRAVVVVLLMACINVSNLLAARMADRRKDVALRVSLGAPRRRLVLGVAAEALLLGLLGGVFGLLLGRLGVALLQRLCPLELPEWVDVGMDPLVFAAGLVLALSSGLLLALLPMAQVLRVDLTRTLKDARGDVAGSLAGVRRLRAHNVLIMIEMALAVPVLVAAGLMMKSFEEQRSIEPGFTSQGLLTFRLNLPRESYDETRSSLFSQQLLDRLRALPQVESAALTTDIPLAQGYRASLFKVEDLLARDPEGEIRVYSHRVSPEFFAVTGIPLLRGSGFSAHAMTAGPEEVVVSRSFAERAWPGQDPIGRRIARDPEEGWSVVAGVVQDVRYRVLLPDPQGNPDDPDIYQPLRGRISDLGAVVRSRRSPQALSQEVRQIVRELDPSLAIFDVATMEQLVEEETALGRFSFVLFGLFAGLALLLIAAGTYGVMSYSVTRRVREIGIRMALGATPQGVLGLVLGEAFWMTAIAIALGLLAAFWSMKLLQSLLFGIGTYDTATFLGGLSLVLATAAAACGIPAWRASRLDPLVSLKTE
jgi:putative ABC transport system permease protein